MMEEAERRVLEATGSLLIDEQVTSCGDDLALVMSHGEVLEPFASAYVVAGRMRGSHQPLMPVAQRHATPSRFDGPRWPDACDAVATS